MLQHSEAKCLWFWTGLWQPASTFPASPKLFGEKCGVCDFLGSMAMQHEWTSVHGTSCSNPKWKAQSDLQQRMWEHPRGGWV